MIIGFCEKDDMRLEGKSLDWEYQVKVNGKSGDGSSWYSRNFFKTIDAALAFSCGKAGGAVEVKQVLAECRKVKTQLLRAVAAKGVREADVLVDVGRGYRIVGSGLDWRVEGNPVHYFTSFENAVEHVYESCLRALEVKLGNCQELAGECRSLKSSIVKTIEDSGL